MELAAVIHEHTASRESSLVQEGPTPRQTPHPPQHGSPAQLSLSQDFVQERMHPPREEADSEAPITTYQMLPQTRGDSKAALLPATGEDQREEKVFLGPVMRLGREIEDMMDQGEQVDFLTELHSQPPVSVSFQEAHSMKHTTAPSPVAEERLRSVDETLGSAEKQNVSVMAAA